ncbi:MAG: c-type cytochrome [Candidatus Omnitrophica bacterium]|nr:c-type cytochrome [Candidatus Omnitrophota bacterium]
MKRIYIAIFIALAVGVTTTQAADLAKAKANYNLLCKGCHGVDGKGDTLLGQKLDVKNFTDLKVQEKLKDDQMFKSIKEGLKKGGKTLMRPYGERLGDQEIKDLVAYIREFKK